MPGTARRSQAASWKSSLTEARNTGSIPLRGTVVLEAEAEHFRDGDEVLADREVAQDLFVAP